MGRPVTAVCWWPPAAKWAWSSASCAEEGWPWLTGSARTSRPWPLMCWARSPASHWRVTAGVIPTSAARADRWDAGPGSSPAPFPLRPDHPRCGCLALLAVVAALQALKGPFGLTAKAALQPGHPAGGAVLGALPPVLLTRLVEGP